MERPVLQPILAPFDGFHESEHAVTGTCLISFDRNRFGHVQGLMWRTYTEEGTLAYSFLDSLRAMYPYYIARTLGGLLFLIGAVIGAYNMWRTIRAASAQAPFEGDVPLQAATAAGRA